MQKYFQYVDAESSTVKRPEGNGWDDPFGDGVWRSSWFYGSVLVIKAKDAATFTYLKDQHDVTEDLIDKFIKYFADNCMHESEWVLPKNPSQKFSGDQLAPMLFLMACVSAFGSDVAQSTAKSILEALIKLDRDHGALSDTHQGQIRDNQRYAIDIVCRMFDIDYLRGARRDYCKWMFSTALSANNALAQLPWPELATQDAFSVFNALALVSEACIKWGSQDEDVDTWRKNYRVHADKGWGPSFRIVSGRSINATDIDAYREAYMHRDLDNDVVMAQRPAKYINGQFFPDPTTGPDRWLVLDYVILKGLQLLWS